MSVSPATELGETMKLTRRGLISSVAAGTLAPAVAQGQTGSVSDPGLSNDHANPYLFQVEVGTTGTIIHAGLTMLVAQPDGQIRSPGQAGLYFRDTRLISDWRISANGVGWRLLNGGPAAYFAARIFLTNEAFPSDGGTVPARTMGLIITRHIGNGMREDLEVSNHNQKPVRLTLDIEISSDFADLFEVKNGKIVQRGVVTTSWSGDKLQWRMDYRNKAFHRGLMVTCEAPGTKITNANRRLSFDITLQPAESWTGTLFYDLFDGDKEFPAPREGFDSINTTEHARWLAEWRRTVVKIKANDEPFYRCFEQGIENMAALRLPLEGTDQLAFVPAAGAPWFLALFGRDSLIVALQNMIVYPEFSVGTLNVLGKFQAKVRDDYRDAEPGKILHELRVGELASFKLIPHTPYYGTADATPLYLILLHAAWRAIGDKKVLDDHMAVAEGCLTWIDNYGDRDGDGFQEYQTRSKDGYENMGWKDSGDAIPYEDGTLVRGPKALCELQGYVYDAWRGMAEIYDFLGQKERAAELNRKADALYRQFNEVFWDEASGFYALTLDGSKRPVFSVASNQGHLLWSGIVPSERARRVVARLMADDMWSGWGIRTLSAKHPAYNPYNYQTGAVWPHDNAIIAAGFCRYGFTKEASQVARYITDAGRHFLLNQLPELYAGLPRGHDSFPVQYIGANVPQAWAAATPFMLLEAMLGLVADASNNRLYLDPALPPWMSEVTLSDLRLGRQTFDIAFWRDGEATQFKVLRGDASLVERRDFVKWARRREPPGFAR